MKTTNSRVPVYNVAITSLRIIENVTSLYMQDWLEHKEHEFTGLIFAFDLLTFSSYCYFYMYYNNKEIKMSSEVCLIVLSVLRNLFALCSMCVRQEFELILLQALWYLINVVHSVAN